MNTQTPEECIAEVEKILGKPFATWMPEPTVNSTVLYGYPKEHLEQSFHHQLQKAREEERERIKKAVEDKLELLTNEEGVVGNRGMSLGVFWFDLSSILTLDHSELDQDNR